MRPASFDNNQVGAFACFKASHKVIDAQNLGPFNCGHSQNIHGRHGVGPDSRLLKQRGEAHFGKCAQTVVARRTICPNSNRDPFRSQLWYFGYA